MGNWVGPKPNSWVIRKSEVNESNDGEGVVVREMRGERRGESGVERGEVGSGVGGRGEERGVWREEVHVVGVKDGVVVVGSVDVEGLILVSVVVAWVSVMVVGGFVRVIVLSVAVTEPRSSVNAVKVFVSPIWSGGDAITCIPVLKVTLELR